MKKNEQARLKDLLVTRVEDQDVKEHSQKLYDHIIETLEELNPLSQYPLLDERRETQFCKDLLSDHKIDVDGAPMSPAVWNLLLSHRDLKMWVEMKMKINKHWKVTHVKNYFGLSGNGQKLLERFEALKKETLAFVHASQS